jgi:hypothetical protein
LSFRQELHPASLDIQLLPVHACKRPNSLCERFPVSLALHVRPGSFTDAAGRLDLKALGAQAGRVGIRAWGQVLPFA